MDRTKLVELELHCCCEPGKLLGYLKVPEAAAILGNTITLLVNESASIVQLCVELVTDMREHRDYARDLVRMGLDGDAEASAMFLQLYKQGTRLALRFAHGDCGEAADADAELERLRTFRGFRPA